MTESRHYSAFISYRHLDPDAYVAEKLQKLLENYRPPQVSASGIRSNMSSWIGRNCPPARVWTNPLKMRSTIRIF